MTTPFEIIDQRTIGNNVFTLQGIAGVYEQAGSPQTFFYIEVLRNETRIDASKNSINTLGEGAAAAIRKGIDGGRSRLERCIARSRQDVSSQEVSEFSDLPMLVGLARQSGRERVRTLMGLPSLTADPEETSEPTAASSA